MKNMKIKVENMTSATSADSDRYRYIPNQFIITTKEGRYFQSYNSIIAFYPFSGKIQLDRIFWDYSKTTGRYRNKFLGINKANENEKRKMFCN